MAEGGVFKWNGVDDTLIAYWINDFPGNPNPILSAGQVAERIWGTSGHNLYVVGRQGALAHFDGTNWKKIETGTESSINDIWGTINPVDSKSTILCGVSNISESGERKILRVLDDYTIDTLSWEPQRSIATVWFNSLQKVYVGGGGNYFGNAAEWNRITAIPNLFSHRIRGGGNNDVYMVGASGLFAHFNGFSWKIFPEVSFPTGRYKGLALRGRLIVAVGDDLDQAVVARGYLN